MDTESTDAGQYTFMSGFTQSLIMVATSAVLSSLLLTFSVNQTMTDNLNTSTPIQSASLIETNNQPIRYTDLSAIAIPPSQVTESEIEDTTSEVKIVNDEESSINKVEIKSYSNRQIVVETTKTPEPIIEPENTIKETVTKSKPVTTVPADTKLDNLIHELTNKARTNRNLSPLTFDTELAQLATTRSEDMIENNYFSHDTPDGCDLSCRFKKSGYVTLSWGENIAEIEGYETKDYAQLAKQFTDNWLESRGHRDNILSKNFTHQGVGVAERNDRVVVTVIFAKP